MRTEAGFLPENFWAMLHTSLTRNHQKWFLLYITIGFHVGPAFVLTSFSARTRHQDDCGSFGRRPIRRLLGSSSFSIKLFSESKHHNRGACEPSGAPIIQSQAHGRTYAILALIIWPIFCMINLTFY